MLAALEDNLSVQSTALCSTTGGGSSWTEVSSVGPSNATAQGAMPYIGVKAISLLSPAVGCVASASGILARGSIWTARTTAGTVGSA